MDNYKIREALPDDIDCVHQCVLALYDELSAYHMPFEVNSLRLYDMLMAYINAKASVILVLEYEGAVSGVLVGHMSKFDGRYIPAHGNVIGRITELYIVPAIRRKHFAEMLLSSAFAWFHSCGINYVETDILMENFVSQEFFKRMGFLPLTQRVYKTI